MFKSGPSLDGSSGNVTILTDNSASLGVSGAVNISTGRLRASGDVVLSPGPSRKSHGGNILLEVGSARGGKGEVVDGGNVTLIAGASSTMICESNRCGFSCCGIDAVLTDAFSFVEGGGGG